MSTTSDRGPRLTHVSVIAADVEESTEFYESVVGCEPIPTPQFGNQEDFHADDGIEFQILRIGDTQLHLWNDPARETESIMFAHFGIHVDNFVEVYHRAEERGVFATVGDESGPPQVFDFNGTAQMYLRDPTGNLVEIDYPDVDALDRSEFANVVTRETVGPETSIYDTLDIEP